MAPDIDRDPTMEEELVGHPLRRGTGTGPSDVEWALLVREVVTVKKALEALTEEVRKANEHSGKRCEDCQPNKTTADHEVRIRAVEKLVWKAMGIASLIASLGGFLLGKIFK